jgi:hypothetical protein
MCQPDTKLCAELARKTYLSLAKYASDAVPLQHEKRGHATTMNAYSYTAKDQTGATTKGVMQAADRGAALAVLKAKGLVPVKVEETSAMPVVGRHSLPTRALVYAAIAVLVLAGGMWLALSRRTEQQPPPAAVPAEGRASPRAVATPATPTAPVTPAVPVTPVAPAPPIPPPADEQSVPAPAPDVPAPAAAIARAQPERKIRLIEAIPAMSTNPPNTGYSSGTEKIINMIVNTRPGSAPPPLLNLPKRENIAEILNRDIIVFDDDSEKTIVEKENVAYAKDLLKKHIADGGNTEDFLAYYHKMLSDAFNERQASQKYTMDLIRAGDKEGAEEYMTEKNKELEAKGIMPIHVPQFLWR